MDILLLMVYSVLLIIQAVLLIRTCRIPTQKRWAALFLLELAALLGSLLLMFVFDGLPGKGSMPGLTYIGEVFYSMGAALLFTLMLVLSFIIRIAQKHRK